MKLSKLVPLGAVFAALFYVSTSDAATITVYKTGNNGAGTLRQAIQDATTGDTINFSITGTITLTSGVLSIDKNLIISGPGARLLTVARSTPSGTPDFGIFEIGSVTTVNISGLTITNASGTLAALANLGGVAVNVSNCTITGNSAASSGGGVFNDTGGTVTLTNCTISNNTALQGAGVDNQGTMILHNCTVANNTATTSANTSGGGGGIANVGGGTLTLVSCTITGNSATTNYTFAGGGGVFNANGGTVHIGNTIVASNSTNQTGDDVRGPFASDGYNLIRNADGSSGFNQPGDQPGTSLSLINANLSPLQNNGGPTDTKKPVSPSNAIDQGTSFGLTTDQRGRLRTSDDPNKPNAFQGYGTDIGAVEVQPSITSTVTNNNDTFEGSLRERILDANADDTINFASNVTGTIMLTNGELLIERNLTLSGPGARVLSVASGGSIIFRIQDGTVQISGLTITAGGGVRLDGGSTTLRRCTISNNIGDHGIFVVPVTTLMAYQCTIVNNQTNSQEGGGLQNYGTTTLTNCTIADNGSQATAANPTGGAGGGIANHSTLTLLNCTVSGNSATGKPSGQGGGGGGIWNFSGASVTLTNTLVAGNTTDQNGTGPDLQGDFTSGGHNLIRINNGSTGFPFNNTQSDLESDLVGTSQNPENANLGVLQNNGGDSDTKAIVSANSPAINAGDAAAAPPTDQRGAPRVGVSDIGAFEFNGVVPTPTPASQLLNVSTRKQVLTGDNRLIAGFIIVGTEPKKVIVLGIGPSLTAFGLPGALADPTLELHDASSTLATNDNWKTRPDGSSQQAEIEATTIPPTNDLESALVASLPAAPASSGGASYTAILAGKDGGTGIGSLQLYDLGQAANSKLANISTRGFVGIGDDVLIGGFIPGPASGGSIKVLVRAIGPSLSVVGISGPLQDPTLELHDSNGGTLATNDNWKTRADGSSQQAEIEATGAAPTDERESALVVVVPPNNSGYTAIVRGVNNTTGIAVVEVYALN